LEQSQNLGRSEHAARIRQRMGSLAEGNTRSWHRVAVFDDDEPGVDAVGQQLLDGLAHEAARLAGANHDHAARRGEVVDAVVGDQAVAIATQVAAHGGVWGDGGQRSGEHVARQRALLVGWDE
jgi:hypothetical protein